MTVEKFKELTALPFDNLIILFHRHLQIVWQLVSGTEITKSANELECDPSDPFHRYALKIDVCSDGSPSFIVRLFH